MMNFILAPLGVLMMLAGAVGLYVAVRGPDSLKFRRSARDEDSDDGQAPSSGDKR